MAFADVDAVKSRAGRVGAAWTVTSTPGDTDIASILADVAGEIGATVAARGFDPTALDAPTLAALRGLNADGALVVALEGTYPGGIPAEVEKLYQGALRRYERGMDLLRSGKHSAILMLEGAATSVPSGSSFWSEDPDYGNRTPTVPEENVYTQPHVARGMPL